MDGVLPSGVKSCSHNQVKEQRQLERAMVKPDVSDALKQPRKNINSRAPSAPVAQQSWARDVVTAAQQHSPTLAQVKSTVLAACESIALIAPLGAVGIALGAARLLLGHGAPQYDL